MRVHDSFHLRTIIFSLIAGIFILTMTRTLTVFGSAGFTYDLPLIAGGMALGAVPFPDPAPKNLPATIEAENFDRGGEGVGYHEITGSTGSGIYRNRPVEGVDIQAFSGASAGFVVTEASAGEWLSYTIFASDAGSYELGIRYTSEFRNGTFHCEIDGKDATGMLTVAPTGSAFRSFFKRVELAAGRHALRLVMDSDSKEPGTGADAGTVCDFDSVSFRLLKILSSDASKESAGILHLLTADRYVFSNEALTSSYPTFNPLRSQP